MKNYTVVRSLINDKGHRTVTHTTPSLQQGVLLRFMTQAAGALMEEGYSVKSDLDDPSFIAIRGIDEPAVEYRLY